MSRTSRLDDTKQCRSKRLGRVSTRDGWRRSLLLLMMCMPLLLVFPTQASECRGECDGKKCHGGCEIITLGDCRGYCTDGDCIGTKASCCEKDDHLIGSNCMDWCVNVSCRKEGEGPGGPEVPTIVASGFEGWTIRLLDRSTGVTTFLAASSEEAVVRSEMNNARSADSVISPEGAGQQEFLDIYVDGACREPMVHLKKQPYLGAGSETGERLRTLVRGISDARRAGEIISLEVLHSWNPEADEQLLAFARENLRVSTVGEPQGFVEFYAMIGALGSEFTYAIAGTTILN